MRNIGWIGLGTMGHPMALNLIKAGYSLKVYNRTKDKADSLIEQGAIWADTPGEAARGSDVVWSMLANDEAIWQVYTETSGVLEQIAAGTIVVDSSTVSPMTSISLGELLAKKQVEFLDAPVSGSTPHAKQGSLVFMAGGSKSTYESCQPFFLAMGKQSFYLGEQGAGNKTKLALNSLLAIQLLGFAETLTLARKAGIDPHQFVDVIMSGAVRSGIVEAKAGKMIDRDFSPQFTSALLLKDIQLALNMAEQEATITPLLANVSDIVRSFNSLGGSDDDMSAIVSWYERASN